MKLNLGKQIVTVENRNLDSVIEQCLEQKLKEKISEIAKREFFEISNKGISQVYNDVKGVISVDGILDSYEETIEKCLSKNQYD